MKNSCNSRLKEANASQKEGRGADERASAVCRSSVLLCNTPTSLPRTQGSMGVLLGGSVCDLPFFHHRHSSSLRRTWPRF